MPPSRAIAAQEIEDLRLHGHVERGRRLVGEQQPGRAGDRHRDDNALAHAAGHFVRIDAQPLLRRRDADLAEEVDRFGARLREAEAAMGSQRLGDLIADADHGMERRSRVLEDHADRRAAQCSRMRSSSSAMRSAPSNHARRTRLVAP